MQYFLVDPIDGIQLTDKRPEKGYVLTVAPHMDDAEYSCMSAYQIAEDQDKDLVLVQVTHGERQANRIKAYAELAELLGWSFYLVQLNAFMDGDGSVTNAKKLVSDLDPLFANASIAFIPEPSMHQDHEFVYKTCKAACRQRNALRDLKEIYAYRYFYNFEETESNVFIELRKRFADIKLEFLQIIDAKYDRILANQAFSIDTAKAMMILAGASIPSHYAESFRALRILK